MKSTNFRLICHEYNSCTLGPPFAHLRIHVTRNSDTGLEFINYAEFNKTKKKITLRAYNYSSVYIGQPKT